MMAGMYIQELLLKIGDPKTGKVTYTTVSKLEPKYTALRKLEAKKADMNANAGTYSVFNIMPPKPAIGKAITFKSSDESVATVDENGLVTVVGYPTEGEVEITATTVDGSNKWDAAVFYITDPDENYEEILGRFQKRVNLLL